MANGENELSPHLQEVEDSFITALTEGGIAAARKLVEELGLEAEAASIVAGGTQQIDSETIDLESIRPPEETSKRLELTRGLTIDSTRARGRYSLALFMLNSVEK